MITTNDSFKLVRDMHGNFTLPISVWTKETEAHLFLCEDNEPPKSNCYWIILRNKDNKNNEIRKCEKNSIPRIGGESDTSGGVCNSSVNTSTNVIIAFS